MAKSYNLTLQLNLQGPANLGSVSKKIKQQLSGITSNVDLKINQKSLKSIDLAAKKYKALDKALIKAKKDAFLLNKQLKLTSGILTGIGGGGGGATAGLNSISSSLVKLQKNAQSAEKSAKGFFDELKGKVVYQAKFNSINATLSLLTSSFNEATRAYIDFERNLNRISQLGGTSVEIAGLSKEIRNLSTSLGVSSADLAQVSVILKQAGNSATEAKTALKALSQASLAPTFSNMTNAVEGTIAVMSQFGHAAEDIEGALDSINTIAGKYAVEFDDLVQAVRRGGGAFRAAAGDAADSQTSLNQYLALFSTVRSTTRESSETIATGLRTITARLQKLSTQKKLRDLLGVDLLDNGNFVGAYEAIDRIGKALNGVSTQSAKFSQVVEAIGGVRQFSRVIPLLTEAEKRTRIFNDAQNSSGSIARDAAKAQDTLAIQLLKTQEAFNELVGAMNEGGGDTFLKGALKGLQAIFKTVKTILPALTALGAMKGLDILLGGKSNGGGGGGGGGGLLGGLLGVGGGGGGKGGGGTTTVNINSANLEASLKDSTTAIMQHLASIKTNTIALDGLTNAINNMAKNSNSGAPFARGGVVPGSGSGDTVPAMLTPGEFVIRKNAVKAIGTDRLHKMNKYGSGGPILKEDQVGALILSGNAGRVGTNTIDKDLILEQFGNDATKAKLKETIPDSKTFELVRNPLSKDKAPTFTGAINAGLIQAVNTSAKKLGDDLKLDSTAISGKVDRRAFLSSVNDGARGNLFEQLIDAAAKSANSLYESSGAQDPFDFVGSLGDALDKLFPAVAEIMYKDGKASYQAASPDDFAKKIGNKLLEEIGYTPGAVTKSSSTDLQSVFEKLKRSLGDSKKGKNAVKQLLAGGTKNAGKVEEKIYDELLAAGYIIETPKAKGQGFDVSIAKGYATGGSVSDTVPAMLTPGEFVINKRAAARIGGAQLEKLNKADKISGFNKGGGVGFIQSFASGGSAVATGDVYRVLKEEFDAGIGDISGLMKMFRNDFERIFGQQSFTAFDRSINKQIINLAKGIGDVIDQSKKDFVINVGKIKASTGDDASKQGLALDSVQALAANSGRNFNEADITKAATDLFNGLKNDLSFEDIKKSSMELDDIFNATLASSEQLDKAIEQLAMSTGIAKTKLEEIATNRSAQSKLEAKQYFSKGGEGEVFSSVLTKLFPATMKKVITSSFITPFANISKGFTKTFGFNTSKFILTLTGVASALGQLEGLVGGGISDTASGRKLSASLGGAQTGGSFGAILGKTVGGEAGAAIGTVLGSIAGGIQGYFKAVETKKLQDSMNELKQTTERLDTAMSTLETNINNPEARRNAENRLRETTITTAGTVDEAFRTTGSAFDPRAYFDGISNAEILAARERFAAGSAAGLEGATTLARQDINKLSVNEAQRRLDAFDAKRSSGANSDELLKGNMIIEADVKTELGSGYATATDQQKEVARQAAIERRAREAYIQREMQNNNGDINLAIEKYNKLEKERPGKATAEGKRLLAERERELLLLKATSEPMAVVNKRLAMLGLAFKKVGQMVDRFGAEFDTFNAKVDDALSSMAGQGTSVESYLQSQLNVLKNPSAYSAREYNQATRGYGSGLSGAANANRMLETALAPLLAGNQEITDVDSLITELKGLSVAAMGYSGAGTFDDLPDNIKQAIQPIFDDMQEAMSSGEDEGSADLSSFAERLNAVFSETGQQAQEMLVRLEEQRIKVLLRHEQLAIKINQLELQRVQHLAQATAIMQDFMNNLKDATSQTVSLDEMNATFENDVASLSGGSTDPVQIFQDMQARAQYGQQLKQDLENAQRNGASEEDQKALINEIQANQAWMDRQAAALEKMANSNETQANAFKKFTEKKERAKGAKSIMDKILSGDFEQIYEANMDLEAGIAGVTGDTGYFAANPAAYGRLGSTASFMGPEMAARAEDTGLLGRGMGMGIDGGLLQQGLGLNLNARGNPADEYAVAAQEAADRQAMAALMQSDAAAMQRDAAIDAQDAMDGVPDMMNQFEQGASDFLKKVSAEYPRIVQDAYNRLERETPPGGVAPGTVTRNSGGVVFSSNGGVGGPNKDTVPAMLTPGEFVINRASTQKHKGLLEAINSGKPIQHANKGGVIYMKTGGNAAYEDEMRRRQEAFEADRQMRQDAALADQASRQANSRSGPSESSSDRKKRGSQLAADAEARARDQATFDQEGPKRFLDFVIARANEGYLDPLRSDGTIPITSFDMAFTKRFAIENSSLVASHKNYASYRQVLDAYNDSIAKRKEEAKVLGDQQEAERQEKLATVRAHSSALSGMAKQEEAVLNVGVDQAMSSSGENTHIKTWRDKTGKFSVNAQLMRVTPDGQIVLKYKNNGEDSKYKDGTEAIIDPQVLDSASLEHLAGTLDSARTESARLESKEKSDQQASKYEQQKADAEAARKENKAKIDAEMMDFARQQEARRIADNEAASARKAAAAATEAEDMKHFEETKDRILNKINVEESYIKTQEDAIRDRGWLGRMGLMGGGMMENEIKLAKQKISGYNIAQANTTKAESLYKNRRKQEANDMLDGARAMVGLPWVKFGTGEKTESLSMRLGGNKVDTGGQDRLAAELDIIDQQKEIGIQTALAVAAPVGGLGAVGARSVGSAMLSAAAPVLAARATENISEVALGEKGVGEAVYDTAFDTTIAAGGGALGYGAAKLGSKVVSDIAAKQAAQAQSQAAREAAETSVQALSGSRQVVSNIQVATPGNQVAQVFGGLDDAAARAAMTTSDDITSSAGQAFVSTGDDLSDDAINALFKNYDAPSPTVTNVNSATGARGGTNLMNGAGKANKLDQLSRVNLEGPNVINTSVPGATLPYGGTRVGGGIINAGADDLTAGATSVVANSLDNVGSGVDEVGKLASNGRSRILGRNYREFAGDFGGFSDDTVRAALKETNELTKNTRQLTANRLELNSLAGGRGAPANFMGDVTEEQIEAATKAAVEAQEAASVAASRQAAQEATGVPLGAPADFTRTSSQQSARASVKASRQAAQEATGTPLGGPANFMGDITEEQIEAATRGASAMSESVEMMEKNLGTKLGQAADFGNVPGAAKPSVLSSKDLFMKKTPTTKPQTALENLRGYPAKILKRTRDAVGDSLLSGAVISGATAGAKGLYSLTQDEELMRKLGFKGKNKGGPIYANNGIFVPKGTDTIPAMLTPGEFVINREAAKKHYGLLEQINSGTLYKKRGGPIYRQNGGSVSGGGGVAIDMSKFDAGVAQFTTGVNTFGEKITSFTSYVDKLSNLKLPNVPDKIEMVGNHNVQVEIRGAQILEGMTEWARNLVTTEISQKLGKLWVTSGGQLGEAPR